MGMTEREMCPTRFLSVADADAAGGIIIARITGIGEEELPSRHGGKENKHILLLENQKPLVLNVTNTRWLFTHVAPNTDGWIGVLAKIVAEQVPAIGGGTTRGLRIRGARPASTAFVANPAAMAPKPNGSATFPAVAPQSVNADAAQPTVLQPAALQSAPSRPAPPQSMNAAGNSDFDDDIPF
jgi:hypothetical protein